MNPEDLMDPENYWILGYIQDREHFGQDGEHFSAEYNLRTREGKITFGQAGPITFY